MSDNDETIQQPAADETVELSSPPPPTDPAPDAARNLALKDRTWTTRVLVAAALAAVLLGGGVGAAIGAASSGSDVDDRRGPGQGVLPGQGGGRQHGGFGQGGPQGGPPGAATDGSAQPR